MFKDYKGKYEEFYQNTRIHEEKNQTVLLEEEIN